MHKRRLPIFRCQDQIYIFNDRVIYTKAVLEVLWVIVTRTLESSIELFLLLVV